MTLSAITPLPETALPTDLPLTLRTATPAEGQTLARHLAADLLDQMHPPPRATMAEMLQTPTEGRPSPQIVTAIYFHAITLANAGWRA